MYRWLGVLFFVDAFIARPLSDTLTVLGVTLTNGPGHRYLTVTWGTPNLEALFVGLVIIVIAQIMYLAVQMNDDQQYTI